MKKQQKNNEWLKMKEGILEQAKHAKEYWGFECLKNATTLVWDIGTEVYFCPNETVKKGKIISVNSFSMCGIRITGDEDVVTYLPSTSLYTNVRYALKEAEKRAR